MKRNAHRFGRGAKHCRNTPPAFLTSSENCATGNMGRPTVIIEKNADQPAARTGQPPSPTIHWHFSATERVHRLLATAQLQHAAQQQPLRRNASTLVVCGSGKVDNRTKSLITTSQATRHRRSERHAEDTPWPPHTFTRSHKPITTKRVTANRKQQ